MVREESSLTVNEFVREAVRIKTCCNDRANRWIWSVLACTANWDKGGIFSFQHEYLRDLFVKKNQGCFYAFSTCIVYVLMPCHAPKSFLCAANSFRGGKGVGVKCRNKSEPTGHTACAGMSLQGKVTGRGHLVEASNTTVPFCKPGGFFWFYDWLLAITH